MASSTSSRIGQPFASLSPRKIWSVYFVQYASYPGYQYFCQFLTNRIETCIGPRSQFGCIIVVLISEMDTFGNGFKGEAEEEELR